MSEEFRQVLSGKYNYTKSKQIYCQENFIVKKSNNPKLKYLFRSEVLSRSHTGEFLKVEVDYCLNSAFMPQKVDIKRSMGEKVANETFLFDEAKHEIQYTFTNGEDTKQHSDRSSSLVQIASPSFATSMLVTMAKKLDPLHRVRFNLISSENIWKYEVPFEQNKFFLEIVGSQNQSMKLSGQEVSAIHCYLFQNESDEFNHKKQEIFLSKYYSVPYKGIFSVNIVIEIAELKTESDLL